MLWWLWGVFYWQTKAPGNELSSDYVVILFYSSDAESFPARYTSIAARKIWCVDSFADERKFESFTDRNEVLLRSATKKSPTGLFPARLFFVASLASNRAVPLSYRDREARGKWDRRRLYGSGRNGHFAEAEPFLGKTPGAEAEKAGRPYRHKGREIPRGFVSCHCDSYIPSWFCKKRLPAPVRGTGGPPQHLFSTSWAWKYRRRPLVSDRRYSRCPPVPCRGGQMHRLRKPPQASVLAQSFCRFCCAGQISLLLSRCQEPPQRPSIELLLRKTSDTPELPWFFEWRGRGFGWEFSQKIRDRHRCLRFQSRKFTR